MARRRRLPRSSFLRPRSCRSSPRARAPATGAASRVIERTKSMPASEAPVYEVYAVRYARHDRPARDNFIGGDPHDVNMPLDYFVWAVVGADKTYVVDMGFTIEQARKRKREYLRSPEEGLKALGIDPAQVENVIVSHMHYDHAGNLD